MSDLTVQLTPGMALPSPILAASGTFGFGEEVADLTDLSTPGALITPTLTLAPRAGNAMPRTSETAAGLLHATGYPNPGLHGFLTTVLPTLQKLPCACIVNIAGENEVEWKTLAETLAAEAGIVALELNLNPPCFWQEERTRETPPTEAELRRQIEAAVSAARGATALPIIAKLPAVGAEIGQAAQAAVEAGADGIAVSQAFPGVAARVGNRAFRFPGVVGGLSGPSIKPLALYQTWRVAQSVSVPILAGGGILTLEDALEFFLTGASAVTVGLTNLIHPNRIAHLTNDLAAYLATHNLRAASDLRIELPRQ